MARAESYKGKGNLVFILLEDRTIMKTSIQVTYIRANTSMKKDRNQLEYIREMIKSGQCRDLNTLAGLLEDKCHWSPADRRYL